MEHALSSLKIEHQMNNVRKIQRISVRHENVLTMTMKALKAEGVDYNIPIKPNMKVPIN